MFNASTIYSITFLKSLNFETPINAQFVSGNTGISTAFLQQLSRKLAAAKLIKSVKGPNGGYLLIKDNVTLSDILVAVGDDKYEDSKTFSIVNKSNAQVKFTQTTIKQSLETIKRSFSETIIIEAKQKITE